MRVCVNVCMYSGDYPQNHNGTSSPPPQLQLEQNKHINTLTTDNQRTHTPSSSPPPASHNTTLPTTALPPISIVTVFHPCTTNAKTNWIFSQTDVYIIYSRLDDAMLFFSFIFSIYFYRLLNFQHFRILHYFYCVHSQSFSAYKKESKITSAYTDKDQMESVGSSYFLLSFLFVSPTRASAGIASMETTLHSLNSRRPG